MFFARQDMADPRRWFVVDLQRRIAMARRVNIVTRPPVRTLKERT